MPNQQLNEIQNVAIHDLQRIDGSFHITHGNEKLQITNTLQRVVDDISKFYDQRTSKSHGRFSDDEKNYPTPALIEQYWEDEGFNFSMLTKKMMEVLRVRTNSKSAAIGGHILFAEILCNTQNIILIVIISDKIGARLNKEMELTDIEHLDIDGFRFAGRINLTSWKGGGDRYIGFLNGKGNTSDYFKEFLGCDTTVLERKNTLDLVQSLIAYCEIEKMSSQKKEETLALAKGICEKHAIRKTELRFEELANTLFPEKPEQLLIYLSHPDRQLNDGFIPNRNALFGMTKIRAKTKNWSMEIDRKALLHGEIVYDKNTDSLTINELPEQLSEDLKRETQTDD